MSGDLHGQAATGAGSPCQHHSRVAAAGEWFQQAIMAHKIRFRQEGEHDVVTFEGGREVMLPALEGSPHETLVRLLRRLYQESESRLPSDDETGFLVEAVHSCAQTSRRNSSEDAPDDSGLDDETVTFLREDEARPVIIVTTDMGGVVDQAERALRDARDLHVYQRGRFLVTPAIVDPATRPKGLRRPLGSPFITPLGLARTREFMSRSARYMSPGGPGQLSPCLPPSWAAESLRDKGNWSVPYLAGVVEAPTLRPDGSIIDVPGYDEHTGLLLIPDSTIYPDIPGTPTRAEALTALSVMLAPFCDFPFVGESDRSAVAAAILTVVARSIIAGPVPLFASRANTPGSGKGLLVQAICVISTGRTPPTLAPTCDAQEMRKLILTLAVEGAGVVLFDNVVGSFGSPTLAAALTTDEWSGRWLGGNKTVTAPLTWIPFVTGNNIGFRYDCGRRVVPMDIQPELEHPEDRCGFRFPDLLAHVRSIRPKLMVAALTILRAHALAGRPTHGGPKMGSFEQWDDLVRSALLWLDAADPCGGRDRVRADDDDDLDLLRAALHAWFDVFGEFLQTTTQAISAAESHPVLRDALASIAPPQRGKDLDGRALGNALRGHRHRVADGMRFDADPKKRGGKTRWRVKLLDGPARAAPRGGDLGAVGDRNPTRPRVGGADSRAPHGPMVPPTDSGRYRSDHQEHQDHLFGESSGDHQHHLPLSGAAAASPAGAVCEACGATDRWAGAFVDGCDACNAAWQARTGGAS